MSRYIELEIQNLLLESGDTALAADRLLQSIEEDSEQLTDTLAIEALSNFLLNAGFTSTLSSFVLRHFDNENFPTPWAYFIEALARMGTELNEDQEKALNKGIRELSLQRVLAKTEQGEKIIPEIRGWRSDYRYRKHKEFAENKQKLLEQLVTLRVQQMSEKEKDLLLRISRIYPGDIAVKKELEEHRQRYALDILAKRSRIKQKSEVTTDPIEVDLPLQLASDALANCIENIAKDNPDLCYDLAILTWVSEAYETSLKIIEFAPESENKTWLRLDLLLKNKRHLELLNELPSVELNLAEDPETFFATAYLRAHAYWGLGQKDTAIDIMEALLNTRPNYRSGESTLNSWKGSF